MFILSLKCETNVDNFYGANKKRIWKGAIKWQNDVSIKRFFPAKALGEKLIYENATKQTRSTFMLFFLQGSAFYALSKASCCHQCPVNGKNKKNEQNKKTNPMNANKQRGEWVIYDFHCSEMFLWLSVA